MRFPSNAIHHNHLIEVWQRSHGKSEPSKALVEYDKHSVWIGDAQPHCNFCKLQTFFVHVMRIFGMHVSFRAHYYPLRRYVGRQEGGEFGGFRLFIWCRQAQAMTRVRRLGAQWHTYRVAYFLWIMTHFLYPHSKTLHQKNVEKDILHKQSCGETHSGNMFERSTAFSCGSEHDSAQRFHSDLSPRGLQPLWREDERKKRREGAKGDFPTSKWEQFICCLLSLLFSCSIFLFLLLMFCRHLELEEQCWLSME